MADHDDGIEDEAPREGQIYRLLIDGADLEEACRLLDEAGIDWELV